MFLLFRDFDAVDRLQTHQIFELLRPPSRHLHLKIALQMNQKAFLNPRIDALDEPQIQNMLPAGAGKDRRIEPLLQIIGRASRSGQLLPKLRRG
jgi:hypothetical protein